MTTDSALREIHKFLLGEGKLDGLWFGDKKDGVTFWWRNKLSAALTAAGDQQPDPAGMVLVPRELTAENGAKAALSGEFAEDIDVGCTECDGSDSDCEECDGEGIVNQEVPVSWDTIKRIHRRTVELFSAAPTTPPPTLNEAFDQLGPAMLRQVCGEVGSAAQVASPLSHPLAPEGGPYSAAPAVVVDEAMVEIPDGAWIDGDITPDPAEADATGCTTGLALYVSAPNDGGPNIRQGRYDHPMRTFIDSTTAMSIRPDLWSSPGALAAALKGDDHA
jgi:hypothetical protein